MMTDDELFVARMADLASLTDRSLITEEEIDRLIALARIGAAVKKAPDPLDEALNSGDGVYRP